jgi:probable rRNA maturation factor
MTYHIDIQNAASSMLPMTDSEITYIAILSLKEHLPDAELTIRFVNEDEMIELNHTYRQQNKTTNVLAFPFKQPPGIELDCPLIGDVIICPNVLELESKQLHKPLKAHWSLIIIHGILHLLGFDHIEDSDAEIMQSFEIKLLAELGYNNPYELEEN